jgi:uncharacterized membrane protein
MDRLHRRLLAVVLALAGAAVVGMVALWPSGDALPAADLGTPAELFDGTIVDVLPYLTEPDPISGTSGESALLTVRLDEGPDAGGEVTVDTGLDGYPPLEAGDRVRVQGTDLGDGSVTWFVVDLVRGPALLTLAVVFVAAVLLISGWQGLRALLGLGLSLGVIVQFVVPAILAGRQPFLVALVGSVVVLVVTLYLAHGVDVKTTTAVLGTAGALVVTVALGALFVDLTQLTGFASEEATMARFAVDALDLRGLVLAGLVIAALGVLDDVTVTQASTVFALRSARPDAGWRELVTRAMVVGRDHIASTVNTLVLAYVGASLALLLLLRTSGLPVTELLTSELLAEEIVKTLVGSLGIVAAVPMTTALAAWAASRTPAADAAPDPGHGHHHG